MNESTQKTASGLANLIGSTIFVAENLDLGPLDPNDLDQENALVELRRALKALNQAADAAAGIVVATGRDHALRAVTTQLPDDPFLPVDDVK